MGKYFIGLAALSLLFVQPASAQEAAEVYKHDGTLQCDLGNEISLSQMARQLRRAGIRILTSRKGHDGRFREMLCGASTGDINIYQIRQADLTRAQETGFRIYRERP
jgi:hypothetical protein